MAVNMEITLIYRPKHLPKSLACLDVSIIKPFPFLADWLCYGGYFAKHFTIPLM